MGNTALLIARRRNEQRRNGTSWIAEFERCIGIDARGIRFVDADTSIQRERERAEFVRSGLLTGSVSRTPSLSLEAATMVWDAAVTHSAEEDVVCELLHHPDFPIVVQAGSLLGKLRALLEYDGDTVGISTPDFRNGVFVDMYPEHDAMAFEIDRWGRW